MSRAANGRSILIPVVEAALLTRLVTATRKHASAPNGLAATETNRPFSPERTIQSTTHLILNEANPRRSHSQGGCLKRNFSDRPYDASLLASVLI